MTRIRFKYFMPERKEFSAKGEETLLSVSEYYGVKPRSEVSNDDSVEGRAESFDGYRMVKTGDFVMNYMLAWKGAFGVSDYDGIVSPAYAVYRIDPRIADRRFIHHRLRSEHMCAEFRAQSKGIIESRLRLYPDSFLSMEIELPDPQTQTAIADFLDRETARIDQLIERKQQLVELADWKRSALIMEVITGFGGLQRSANSDLQYSEVTGYWPSNCSSYLKPLKHVCSMNPESLSESTNPDFEFEYIDIGNVSLQDGIVAREWMQFSDSPSRARKPVRAGDVIISTVRTYLKAIALIGQNAGNWIVSTGFSVLRPNSDMNSRYLHRAVQSNPFLMSVAAASTGVSYPAINPSTLGNILIPCPEPGIQSSIADVLDRETGRIDKLKKGTLASIEILREHRSALITAAVTGQIDVATWRKRGQTERNLDAMEEAASA